MSAQERLSSQLKRLHAAERRLASSLVQMRLGCAGDPELDREVRRNFRQAERQVRSLERSMMVS